MLQIIKYISFKPKILTPLVIQYSKGYTTGKTCTSVDAKKLVEATCGTCPTSLVVSKGKDDGGTYTGIGLRRAKAPGKVRLGFIPEEWFLFLHPMTGVSGPYILMIGLANYMASKEIFVMEHEYYLGISMFIVLYTVTTKFGSTIGSALDKGVDEIANELEQGRINEIAAYQKQINDAKTTIWRAEGQKDLIEAKKENVKMQLEAVFRERQMVVHRTVRRRMEYHRKQHWVTTRIRHKWMVKYILKQVHAGITPDFKKKVMDHAISDLTALADKYQAAAGKK